MKRNKKVIIWVHELDPDLLRYLREENVEVVAVIQGASIDGVPSISPFDLFYRTQKIDFNLDDSTYIHLSDSLLNRYMDCISRFSFIPMTEEFTYVEIGVIGPDNVVDWAQYQAQTVLSLLQQYEPDEIWITHIPHLGIDNLLVEIGIQLGLTVLTFNQSLMPGKFFFNIIGDDSLQTKLEFDLPEEKEFSPNLFYMSQGDNMPTFDRLLERCKWYVLTLFAGRQAELTVRFYRAVQKRDWALPLLLMDCMGSKTREVAFTRFVRRLRFSSELKRRVFCNENDLMKPFIYFTLHLEPEATTSALGGLFSNQMNAIEAMRKNLPAGWWICVKENPKQRYMYRDLPFYSRARQWPDVKFVDDLAQSEDLINRSRIVASVTGTVGYEALLLGKPCIYFGDAWYAGLPNAFKFIDTLDLEEVSRLMVDAHELNEAVRTKMGAAADGVIFPWARGFYEDKVSWPELMRTTAKSLARISDSASGR